MLILIRNKKLIVNPGWDHSSLKALNLCMVGDMYTEVPCAFSHHNRPVFLAVYWKFITEKRKEQEKNIL